MLNRARLTIGSLLLATAFLAGCGTRTTTLSTTPTGSSTPPTTTPGSPTTPTSPSSPTTPPSTPTSPTSPTPPTQPTPHLDHISIAPASLTVAPGASFNFTATAYDQNNNLFTAPISWTSDGNPVTNGSGTAQNAGQTPAVTHISAVSGSVTSAAAILTVTGAPSILTSTNLTPVNPTAILTGQTQQFSASGIDQFGNMMQGLPTVYSSSDQTVATIDQTGKATASFTHPGTTVISATVGGVPTKTSTLVVNPAPSVLYSVVITPNASSDPAIPKIPALTSFKFTANEFDQFGQPLSIPLAWSTSNANATVTASNSEGTIIATVTGVTPGVVAISVTVPTVPSFSIPSFQVTIDNPPPPVLAMIHITPAHATFDVGATQQFTAHGKDQYGNAFTITAPIVWTSATDGSSSISPTGLATGLVAGPSSATATVGTVSGTVFFTLTTPPPPPPAPPTISQLSPPIALSGSAALQYLTITGTNFGATAVVNFGSNILTPATVSANSITVRVPAGELRSAATLAVTVTNTGAVPATSNPLNFVISDYGFVSIDFDDSYQSTYDNGLPIFDAAGIRTTQYVITGSPGNAIVNPDAGPVGIADVSGNPEYMTWAEVQTMAANGHEIGAHTRTHQSLSTLCGVTQPGGPTLTPCIDVNWNPTTMNDTLDLEIGGSKSDLIAQGLNPLTLAYPYGDYGYPSPTVGQAVQAAGYLGARDSDTGFNGLSQCAPGRTVNNCNHLYPFYLWSEGAEYDLGTTQTQLNAWIQYAHDNKVWLIILLHRVDENDPNSVAISIDSTPEAAAAAGHPAGIATLQGIVDYIQQNGISTVTNSEGLVIENLNGQTSTFQFPD
jgi:peptidoglycan/xylan/chitin deacetylase (PgdA/CDA1 family)